MASTLIVPFGDNKADNLASAVDSLHGTVVAVVDGGNRWVVIYEPKTGRPPASKRAPGKKETR